MQSRAYVTVRCPSVCPSVCLPICLSHLSTAASACGGFAAERPAAGRYRSIAARRWALRSSGAAAALDHSSICGQFHLDRRRRRLNNVLLNMSSTRCIVYAVIANFRCTHCTTKTTAIHRKYTNRHMNKHN